MVESAFAVSRIVVSGDSGFIGSDLVHHDEREHPGVRVALVV